MTVAVVSLSRDGLLLVSACAPDLATGRRPHTHGRAGGRAACRDGDVLRALGPASRRGETHEPCC